ncbi:MAG TPA: class I SAM-dependent methyltransferase [Gemmatimonadales bacterium]|nr:class I SAM-dependent methyltransferase [Gemmatimonadales bacterium]
MKFYNQAYFDRWYRDPAHRIGSRADLERAVRLAVALAESVVMRPIASVLDVGAGEGRWQPVLARMRPQASYIGIEPSEWAVAKWGKRRQLIEGDLDSIGELGLGGPFDLVVVADVLHYLPTPSLRRGLLRLAPFVGGAAWCPTFTSADQIDGDREEFQRRPPAAYHREFAAAGLWPIGMHGWVPRDVWHGLAALERGTP